MNRYSLFDAAFSNDAQGIVKAVAAGMDPNMTHPRGGHTALSVACEAGAEEAVASLLKAGADPRQRFDWASQVSGRASSGRTALMSAATPNIVRMLVSAGAELEAIDSEGWSALAHAVDMVYPEVVVALLACRARAGTRPAEEARDVSDLLDEKLAHLLEIGGSPTNPEIQQQLEDLAHIRELLQTSSRSLHTAS